MRICSIIGKTITSCMYCVCFFFTLCIFRSHIRSKNTKKILNKKRKLNAKENKGVKKTLTMLAEKDHAIEVLQKKIKGQRKLELTVKPMQKQTSIYCATICDTLGKRDNISRSRKFILENLHSIPRFEENNFNYVSNEVVGSGQFGIVNRGNIKS